MIDSIFTAMSGLEGHQKGLKVISNNVANMNTAGFKATVVDFADVFTGAGSERRESATGAGVEASRTRLDLRNGDRQDTGRELDVALDGRGFLVLQDEQGRLRYTRAGGFALNDAGQLVASLNGLKVMGRDGEGRLAPIELGALRKHAPKGTTKVVFKDLLSSSDDAHTIDALTVYDSTGGAHVLKLEFTKKQSPGTGTGGNNVEWVVKVFEGSKELGTGLFGFIGSVASPFASSFKLNLAYTNAPAAEVEFSLGSAARGDLGSTESRLQLQEQDGYAPGDVASVGFDEKGQLAIGYSNGQKATGATLALAEFASDEHVMAVGDGLLASREGVQPTFRAAGTDLKVLSKKLELSNVNLTQEFSTLILMQRGYQASSQVLTTANEMLQQLFELKGRR
ncbi:flagellar hook-basal body complex protein [Aquabacterium sp. A7-Y]|uniref:flagellar hook-basal body complex protein n=1 Tax=Aquabacterium sp. A7-Y TaxID=1349605 RepID=UPI00223CA537|nr:flagellar hook-basal body complex protein [Aquabacterium sp. A7-Y]MCW7540868.1 flagellar hook-basal body complex protein [Aquabacterium sp. A7-Y]